MKIFGIDHGESNWGFSRANEILKISTPLCAVKKEKVIDFLKTENISKNDLLVFGLPFSMSGRYSTQTFNVINDAIKLKDLFNCKVFFVDERLTSKQLFQSFKKNTTSKKIKKSKDSNSSSLILSVFLQSNKGIELEEQEIYNANTNLLFDKKLLVFNIAIKPLEKNYTFEIYCENPWIFWYYFKEGFKSTSLINDLSKEYDLVLKTKKDTLFEQISYNEKIEF
jgi:putative Holliday junction resolvase